MTVAGNGVSGSGGDYGPATSANLQIPYGVAVDTSGNVFVTDSANNRIREIVKSTGKIITVAGNGTAGSTGDGGLETAASLNVPEAIAIDAQGNLYITERVGQRIRKVIKSTGKIVTVAGNGVIGFSGDNGPAISANLNGPTGVEWISMAICLSQIAGTARSAKL